MSIYFWLFIALYIYCPYLHFELSAQRNAMGKYRWQYPNWFIVMSFVAWPVLTPLSVYLMRKNQERGLI